MNDSVKAINYKGSKWKIYRQIEGYVHGHSQIVELFGGGFSLSLNLLHQGIAETAIYNDLDVELINYFNVLKCSKDELIRYILAYASMKSAIFPCEGSCIERAAYFYMKHSNNWKVTRNMERDLNIVSDLLNSGRIEILSADYSDVLTNSKTISDSALIIIDPPYKLPGNKCYYKRGKKFNHKSLYEYIKDIKDKHDLIVFYNDDKEIKTLYSEFIIKEIEVNYIKRVGTEIAIINM